MTSKLWAAVFFACLIAVATALRWSQIADSLWLDELHTSWTVSGEPSEIRERAVLGNQSPAWFYGVWAAQAVLGPSEFALRAPSLLAGVLLVATAGVVARRWTSSWLAGLLVVWLVATDPHCRFYAQEARPYAWVQWIGLVQVAIFCELLEQPRWALRVAWIALSLLLFYLHFTASLLVLAEAVAYVVLTLVPGLRPAYRVSQALLDLAVVAAGTVPAFQQLVGIAGRRENWAAFVPHRPFPEIAWAIFPLWLYLTIPLAVATSAHVFVAWGRRLAPRTGTVGSARWDPRLARFAVVCLSWLFVPLLATWVSTRTDLARLFFVRYVIVAAVAPAMITGILLTLSPTRYWKAVLAIVVAAASLDASGMLTQLAGGGGIGAGSKQDWRAAIASLEQAAGGSSCPIFVRSGLIEADSLRGPGEDRDLRAYCLLPVRGLYRIGVPDERLVPLPTRRTGQLIAREQQRIAAAGEAWFLLAGSSATAHAVMAELRRSWSRGGQPPEVVEQRTFRGVTLVRVRAARAEPG